MEIALNPANAKNEPQLLEDTRCSLLGNTWHAGVFALLFAPLFVRRGILSEGPTPQDVVDRAGLFPGESFVPGLRCDLGRPPSYHWLDGRRRGYLHPSAEAARAACSPDRRAWVERMQRALDAELGRGFTVGRTPKVPLLTITDTATRRVHVCAGRRDFKSTWRFQGNFFYRIVEEHGRRIVVPILNPGAAVDELYRKLEETYVPFTWRDPNDLMEDDLAEIGIDRSLLGTKH